MVLTVVHKIINSGCVERFFFTVEKQYIFGNLRTAGDGCLGKHLEKCISIHLSWFIEVKQVSDTDLVQGNTYRVV